MRNDVVTPGRRLITQVAQVGSSITRGIKIAITISHEKFIYNHTVLLSDELNLMVLVTIIGPPLAVCGYSL